MKTSRASLSAGFFLGLLVAASSANAQSYGQEDQVLTIGAAEFQAEFAPEGSIQSDGYLYSPGGSLYLAPLSLPEGALIERMCLYANDYDLGDATAVLYAVKLVPGGESDRDFSYFDSFLSSANVGYGQQCTGLLSHTLRGRIDIDGDGSLDAVAWYVKASMNFQPGGDLGLGGVQITWKRQVSPPPATPTFNDVPASDLAFQFIEALAASGITAGCAGGNYCPNATLTRRQMAVFLAKALGLHWAN